MLLEFAVELLLSWAGVLSHIFSLKRESPSRRFVWKTFIARIRPSGRLFQSNIYLLILS